LTPSAAYGDAVHKTFQWLHAELRRSGRQPSLQLTQTFFSDMLARKHLRKSDQTKLEARGREALERFLKARKPNANDIVERGFNNEGVVVAGANLSGKIDLLHFLDAGTLEVRDFKTGKPARSWQGKDEYEKIKLHKYRQQLLFYKLLVEQSASFHKKATVARGALEFVEPDEQGRLVSNLELKFDADEQERFIKLIGAVWAHISHLDFPDTDSYPQNLRGILAFEDDLISGRL
jgi:DNA helicase-2/ATP-dependent DNA helicase PcrA